ncbi:MAG: sensor histidine kinase, partial [Ensifer adhaerens]
MRSRNPSLIGIVARRIIAFSLLAMAIQIGVVFADYWFDDDKLSVLMLQQETENLIEYVQVRDGVARYEPNRDVRERYLDRSDDNGAIFLRIRTASGEMIH